MVHLVSFTTEKFYSRLWWLFSLTLKTLCLWTLGNVLNVDEYLPHIIPLSECVTHQLSWWTVLCKGIATLQPETQHKSGQTPNKEAVIRNITVYVSGYTETDTTGMLSPPTVWRQQSEFVSSWPCGQIPAAVCMGLKTENKKPLCRYKYGHACLMQCSHACLRCTPRQMLVCHVVLVLAPM